MSDMDEMDAELVAFVREHDGVTQDQLARRFAVSTRTVRTYVAHAQASIAPFGRILHKRGGGYRLELDDTAALESLMAAACGEGAFASSTAAGRALRVIGELLWREDWVTLDYVAESLFVSRSTVSRDMQIVSHLLEPYGLKLENRPYRGVRIIGGENDRRVAFVSLSVGKLEPISGLVQSVRETTRSHGIELSHDAFKSLVTYLAIAIERMRTGVFADMPANQLERIRRKSEFEVACQIAAWIEAHIQRNVPDGEIAYIAVHLMGRQTLAVTEDNASLVIPQEVWEAVSQILDAIQDSFQFDFKSDLELRMNLAQHIVPLSIRLQYHLRLDNALTGHIQERYPLAFSMALCAAKLLSDVYGQSVSEDEAAYLALAFVLALERRQNSIVKKSILVVCASGRGTARLLEYRCRQEFGPYIRSIEMCDVAHVAEADFSQIDYVFTTVPLHIKLPVPIRMVSLFLDSSEIDGIKHLFRRGDAQEGIGSFFSERLFFPHLSCATKWEAIQRLSAAMVVAGEADENLEGCVAERERAFPTSFGEGLAVPHAAEPTGRENRIAVGLLEKPVAWDEEGHLVSVVLLTSYSQTGKSLIADVFSAIATGLLASGAIDRLVADRSYDTLMQTLGIAVPEN